MPDVVWGDLGRWSPQSVLLRNEKSSAIPLGIQHVLAMFVSNVTPAIIIAGAAGIAFGPGADPEARIYLLQMAMMFAGVATLIQTIGIGPVGARLPIV